MSLEDIEGMTLLERTQDGGFTNPNEEAKPEATETTETKPETTETKPEASDTKPEEQKPVETTETKPEVPEWQFDINGFGKWVGKEFKDENEIKTVFEKADKLTGLEQELTSKSEYLTKLESIVKDLNDQTDPIKMYGSEEAYKNLLIEKKISEGRDKGVVQKVITTDWSKSNDIDAAVTQVQFESPTVANKPDAIKKAIYEEIGVDINDPEFNIDNVELSPSQQVKLARMGSTARLTLNGLKTVDIPDRKDIFKEFQEKEDQLHQRTETLSQQWGDVGSREAENFTKVEFNDKDENGEEKVDFTFQVPKEFKDRIPELIKQTALKKNLDYSEESLKQIRGELRETFETVYRDQIRKAYVNEKLAKQAEAHYADVHNLKPINEREAPNKDSGTYEDNVNNTLSEMLKGQSGI